MLVFISDLHMTDGTSGVTITPPQAFEGTFHDIERHAIKAGAREITLVFLGDIFDMVRTRKWFLQPDQSHRPWGRDMDKEAVGKLATELFDEIVNVPENKETLRLIRSLNTVTLKDGTQVTVKHRYIPGNHDRICNEFDGLRKRVIEELDLRDDHGQPLNHTQYFDTSFSNQDYRCLARHGHEWDEWNFCGVEKMLDAKGPSIGDYQAVPMGDLMACEFAAKLPYITEQKLLAASAKGRISLSETMCKGIVDRLKFIDDVRPVSAMIPWLTSHLAAEKQTLPSNVLAVIKDAVEEVLEQFDALPYVEEWIDSHNHWYSLNAADAFKYGPMLLHAIKPKQFLKVLPLIGSHISAREQDNLVQNAAEDFKYFQPKWDEPCLYVIYGHTHNPAQVPISYVIASKSYQSRVYLNTGTWRPLTCQSSVTGDFMSWKTLTYTILYHQEIDGTSKAAEVGYPTFETWTGSLLEETPISVHEVPEGVGEAAGKLTKM